MRAEVTYFDWHDLERARAEGEYPSSTLLIFAAGTLGQKSGETFQVIVCTPDALSELVSRDGVVIGRHHLFVSSIGTGKIEEFVRDRLRRLDAESWTELAEKIARIGHWEFEDYTEYRER